MKSELKRKSLHLTGLVVPIFYLLFGREATLTLVGTAFFLFVMLEPFRIIEELRDNIKRRLRIYVDDEVFERVEVLERHIDEITRSHERYRVAAHIYFAAASFVVVYFFSMEIAVGAITVATVGDALAAIVGKSRGRHRFPNGKSLEGSMAYLLSGLLILWPLVGFLPAIIGGALSGTVVEFYGIPPLMPNGRISSTTTSPTSSPSPWFCISLAFFSGVVHRSLELKSLKENPGRKEREITLWRPSRTS